MKLFPTTLNVHGDHIHPLAHIVTDRLCEICPDSFKKVDSIAESEVVITNAPSAPPYDFDKKLADKIDKPIVIFNDADGYMPDCDEKGFGELVRTSYNIKLYFYREWWKGYGNPFSFQMVPFDIVTDHPKYERQTLEGFCNRSLDVFWSQSIHTLSRKELWEHRSKLPTSLVNDKYRHCFSAKSLFDLQNEARITIALEGGGIKCQSHCEACVNSVMVMPDLEMVEPYPWIDGENCIRLPYKFGGEGSWLKPEGRGIIDIEGSLLKLRENLVNPNKLYAIYCAGIANAENYRLPNYYRNHVAESILKYV